MWSTQKRDQFSFRVGGNKSLGSATSLREALLDALSDDLGSSVLPTDPSEVAPDFFFKLPESDRVALVELKFGDPGLPLPSSTSSQIKLLRNSLSQQSGGKSPTSIVVTNYTVFPDQRKELAANGIKLVTVPKDVDISEIVREVRSAAASTEVPEGNANAMA
jgi:hypothetical protein